MSAARVGDALSEVDTPALILDLDAFDRNQARMGESLAQVNKARQAKGLPPISFRPHAKSHKCPDIARQQMAHGAMGICCQKVSEAKIFADAGVGDILISNEVVGEKKIQAIGALAQQVKLTVCVDHLDQARALNQEAIRCGIRLNVLIEMDVGAGRCGIAPGQPCLELAQAMRGLSHLNCLGLQAYHGPAQHMRLKAEREAALAAAIDQVIMTRDLLRDHGIVCEVIAGAGTGSFLIEAMSSIYTEVQPGSYLFMDVDYARNDWALSGMPHFEHSLFVLSTVMSAPTSNRRVLDAGLKASSVDSGMPRLADHSEIEFIKASDEHGVLIGPPETIEKVCLGDKLRLIPGHCDPTVNLYNEIIGVRQGRVESIWPIAARGALL